MPLSGALAAIRPNDQYYYNQWYLEKIMAPQAWEEIKSSPDIVVAVIDSGIQIDHPDLRDNIWENVKEIAGNGLDDDANGFVDDSRGWDFVTNMPDPNPVFGDLYTDGGLSHGTIVSGIIAAVPNNNLGIAGVTWKTKIMPLKALNDKGEGRISDVVRAIDYASNNGADIINLSFVGQSYSQDLLEAIERAYKKGVIIVAAAGNDSEKNGSQNLDVKPLYPACYRGSRGENLIIGVSATDTVDGKANFSSYGSKCVDISAPGVSFYSAVSYHPSFENGTYNRHFEGYWSGTSMAAPLVAGALALVKEVNPNLSRDEIVNVVLKSSDDINPMNPAYTGQLGYGRLNIYKAIIWAKEKLSDYSGYILLSPYFSSYSRNFKNENHALRVKILSKKNQLRKEFALGKSFIRQGLNLASGDVDGDGQVEIVVAYGYGGEPKIEIYSSNGILEKQFLAYDSKMTGGVNVACGDLDGNLEDEIIVSPAYASSPEVRIFNSTGKMTQKFMAYASGFKGGLSVASGDVDGDGFDDIVTGAGQGGGPHVRVFTGAGKLKAQFMAYGQTFRGGVKVQVANLDGRKDGKKDEIITAPGEGMETAIRIFDNYGAIKKQFNAFERNFQNGISLAAGDLNNDGSAEIIAAAGPGGAPHVRIFNPKGELLESYYAMEEGFNKGLSLGFISLPN